MVARTGFGLVEVIVAMTLLGIGVMSVGASAAFASRSLRTAENEEAAYDVAAVLADSLAAGGTASDGARDIGRFATSWIFNARQGSVSVDVALRDAPAVVIASLRGRRMPSLPELPCEETCDE